LKNGRTTRVGVARALLARAFDGFTGQLISMPFAAVLFAVVLVELAAVGVFTCHLINVPVAAVLFAVVFTKVFTGRRAVAGAGHAHHQVGAGWVCIAVVRVRTRVTRRSLKNGRTTRVGVARALLARALGASRFTGHLISMPFAAVLFAVVLVELAAVGVFTCHLINVPVAAVLFAVVFTKVFTVLFFATATATAGQTRI
jgi:hypothetical protein